MSDMTTIEQDAQDRTLRERQDAPTPRTEFIGKYTHDEIWALAQRIALLNPSGPAGFSVASAMIEQLLAEHNASEGYPGIACDFETCKRDLAAARAEIATVRAQLDAVTRERELVITERKRVAAELHEAMQPHFRDSSIANLRTALHKQDATVQDYQRRLSASEAARVAAEQDAGRLREALQSVRRDICGCDTDDYCDYCGVVNHQPHSRSCVSRTIDAALAAGRTDAGTEGGGK